MNNSYYTPSVFKRYLAYLTDIFVFSFFWIPSLVGNIGLIVAEKKLIIDFRLLVMGYVFSLVAKICFYFFIGATPGKLFFGLRLVQLNYQPLTLVQCFLRVTADELSLFVANSLRGLALFRLDRRHFSDWVAETQVVQLKPMDSFPKRHLILTIFIFLTQLHSGITRAYYIFQHMEIKNGKIYISG